jgi:hypothetical protein
LRLTWAALQDDVLRKKKIKENAKRKERNFG